MNDDEQQKDVTATNAKEGTDAEIANEEEHEEYVEETVTDETAMTSGNAELDGSEQVDGEYDEQDADDDGNEQEEEKSESQSEGQEEGEEPDPLDALNFSGLSMQNSSTSANAESQLSGSKYAFEQESDDSEHSLRQKDDGNTSERHRYLSRAQRKALKKCKVFIGRERLNMGKACDVATLQADELRTHWSFMVIR